MSDQSLSDDELASALLDGEADGPSPVDPAVAARVEEFRRAPSAIGAPVTVDDGSRERAIEAALLHSTHRRRRRRRPRPGRDR